MATSGRVVPPDTDSLPQVRKGSAKGLRMRGPTWGQMLPLACGGSGRLDGGEDAVVGHQRFDATGTALLQGGDHLGIAIG